MLHMIRLFRFRRALRLCGWSLFAGFLALLGLSLYVVLEPRPRWVLEAEGKLGSPLCFLKDGSGVVFWMSGARDTLSVRDARTGEELDSFEGEKVALNPFHESRFLVAEGHLFGVQPHTGQTWHVSLPPFIQKVIAAQASPEGDLHVLTVKNPDETGFCAILDAQDGRLLGRLPFEEEAFIEMRDLGLKWLLPREGKASLDLTPEFVLSFLPKHKSVALWNRSRCE